MISQIERIGTRLKMIGGWINVAMGVCFMILFVLLEGNAIEVENLEVFGIGIALVSLGFSILDRQGKPTKG